MTAYTAYIDYVDDKGRLVFQRSQLRLTMELNPSVVAPTPRVCATLGRDAKKLGRTMWPARADRMEIRIVSNIVETIYMERGIKRGRS